MIPSCVFLVCSALSDFCTRYTCTGTWYEQHNGRLKMKSKVSESGFVGCRLEQKSSVVLIGELECGGKANLGHHRISTCNKVKHILYEIAGYLSQPASMAKPKFYAVAVGRAVGIFNTWADCENQVCSLGGGNSWFSSFS